MALRVKRELASENSHLFLARNHWRAALMAASEGRPQTKQINLLAAHQRQVAELATNLLARSQRQHHRQQQQQQQQQQQPPPLLLQ